jgi:hypothetical protein
MSREGLVSDTPRWSDIVYHVQYSDLQTLLSNPSSRPTARDYRSSPFFDCAPDHYTSDFSPSEKVIGFYVEESGICRHLSHMSSSSLHSSCTTYNLCSPRHLRTYTLRLRRKIACASTQRHYPARGLTCLAQWIAWWIHNHPTGAWFRWVPYYGQQAMTSRGLSFPSRTAEQRRIAFVALRSGHCLAQCFGHRWRGHWVYRVSVTF